MNLDLAALAEALAHNDVVVAYAFGSRVDGTARADSDLDLAVLTDSQLGLLDQVRLADQLRLISQVPHIDLVVLNRASLELRGHVVCTGHRIFSSDETRRVRFEVQTMLEYLDFEPTLRQLTDSYLKRVAAGAG